MTDEEINKLLAEHHRQEHENSKAVVDFARQLVFTLRDSGRESSAKELERLLFTLDATDQEFTRWMAENGREVLPVILKQLRGQL